jgi:hypothetical protein
MNKSTIRYQAIVYHGGNLLGLGRWASGKRWQDRERAEAEGERLARQCGQLVGGKPVVQIQEFAGA